MIKYLLLSAGLLAGIVLLFLHSLMNEMPSDGMMPSIKKGTYLMVVPIGYSTETLPQNGQVVMYQTYRMEKPAVARIAGCPGDKLSLNSGLLTLNGHTYIEPYVLNKNDAMMPLVEVPKNRYFVLNDNRSILLDSRDKTIGMIKLEDIKGKVVLVF